jgi:hypothetical protein
MCCRTRSAVLLLTLRECSRVTTLGFLYSLVLVTVIRIIKWVVINVYFLPICMCFRFV